MLKKIYEELIAIRTELQLIRKYTEPKKIKEGSWELTIYPSRASTPEVEVSFSLDGRGWSKLRCSDAWKETCRLLQKYQKKYNQKHLKENPG